MAIKILPAQNMARHDAAISSAGKVVSKRGIVLVVTLWILTILAVLAGSFAVMVRTETQVAHNYGDLIRCRWAARAGIWQGENDITQIIATPYIYLGGSEYTPISPDLTLQVGQFSCDTTIQDEAGKVNINTASVEVLTTFFGSSDIANSIVAWRTPGTGADDEYYTSLQPPYKCKHAPFSTVGELLLVKGVTPALLQTPDANGVKLEDLVTVYSTDLNTSSSGGTRLNIQTASQSQMRSSLGSVLSNQDINAIIRQRSRSAFTSAGAIINVSGLARGKVQNIYDRITVTTNRNRPGLVNINTAPSTVLAALPGFDQTIADAIIKYRENTTPFTDVGQLLAVSAVSNAAFASAADLLTTRSRNFKIVATGYPTQGTSSHTVNCVVSVNAQLAQHIEYWQE